MTCFRCNRTGNCQNCSCVKNGKICSDSLLRRLEKCQNNGMAPGIQTTVSGSSTHQAAAQNTLSLLSSTTSFMTSSAVSNQETTITHHIKPEVAKCSRSPSSNNSEHPQEISRRVPPSFTPQASFPSHQCSLSSQSSFSIILNSIPDSVALDGCKRQDNTLSSIPSQSSNDLLLPSYHLSVGHHLCQN